MFALSETVQLTLRKHSLLVGRLLISLLFIVPGLKFLFITKVSFVANMIDSIGIPLSGMLSWVVVLTLIIAGVAILFGYKVELASASLIIFLIFATYFFHINGANGFELNATLSNMAAIGGLIYIMTYGTGNGWKLSKGL